MGDLGKIVQDESGATRPGTDAPAEDRNARTAGTDRDYDESQESKNQGHGHEHGTSPEAGNAGHSEEKLTETDRQERDLGGPGG
jgi:hypothetical protein